MKNDESDKFVTYESFTTQMILRIPPPNLYNKGIIFFRLKYVKKSENFSS